MPFAESPDFSATLLAHVEGAAIPAAEICSRLRNVDSFLMIGEIRRLAATYATALAPRRFITIVLTTFAGLGLLLAAMGVYGLVATSVAQRTREFGIRFALGASRERVRRMVLREAGVIIGVGAGTGALGATAGMGLLRSQLFGVDAIDAPTLVAAAFILAAAGLAATWIPVRRAASVDPAVALRVE